MRDKDTIQFSLVSICWQSYHTALTTMFHQTFSTYIPFAGPRLFFTSQHTCTAIGVLSGLNPQGRLGETKSLEQQRRDPIYTLKLSHTYTTAIRATLTWRHEPLTAQSPHHLWKGKLPFWFLPLTQLKLQSVITVRNIYRNNPPKNLSLFLRSYLKKKRLLFAQDWP